MKTRAREDCNVRTCCFAAIDVSLACNEEARVFYRQSGLDRRHHLSRVSRSSDHRDGSRTAVLGNGKPADVRPNRTATGLCFCFDFKLSETLNTSRSRRTCAYNRASARRNPRCDICGGRGDLSFNIADLDTFTSMPAREELLYLYRHILRTHRKVLPRPMRLLGDGYAREEWRRHKRGNANREQWTEFAKTWTSYCDFLRGNPGGMDRSGELSKETLNQLTKEQKLQLKSLKDAIDLLRER